MPAVKKPKPNHIKKAAAPTKKPEEIKTVVSGQLKKKLPKKNTQQKERPKRGVILVKHLPHGFFEDQLRKYFRQFGHVTRLRLARSERTGGSKGFAFVEFEHPEVAEIAANTMDNYLMFQKVVKAKYIPPDQQNFNYFKNRVKLVKNKAGKEIYVSKVTKATHHSVKKQNDWTEAACQKRTVAGIKKLNKLQQKYKHLGINFSNLLVEPQKKSKDSATTSSASKATVTKKAKKSNKQEKEALKLEDLLGNTINEDSDDEDYVDEDEISSDDAEDLSEVDETEDPIQEFANLIGEPDEDIEEDNSEEDISSDESDAEDNSEVDESMNIVDLLGKSIREESDDEDYVDEEEVPTKKSKKPNTGAERQADLLKRRQGTGGVQKKKPAAKAQKTVAAQKLQLAAAKKIAKPLQKVSKKLKK